MNARQRLLLVVAAIGGYVTTIVAANWLTARYGFAPVGFGLTATAGTYAAGASLTLRNIVQDVAGRRIVLAAIVTGALLSWLLSTPQLAVASGVTFLIAETADFTVYTPLRKRGWARAAIAGNTVGALIDTVLFLHLAGFPILAAIPGQLVGKAWATCVYLLLGAVVSRVVLREPVHAEGA